MNGQARERAPDLEAVDNLLRGDGECAHCKEQTTQRVVIALVPGNSGPGWTVYGCIPCAKKLSRCIIAPRWLKADVARLIGAGL